MSKIRAKTIIKTVTDDGMRLDYSFVAGTPMRDVFDLLGMVAHKKYNEAELQEKLRPYIEAMAEFVERCEKGEVRSKYTYSKFKALIDNNGDNHE